jgi:hypothetical protein
MQIFKAFSHSGGKLLLHSCPLLPSASVYPSVCISVTPSGRISVKFIIGDFLESLSRNSRFGCRALSMKI